MALKKIVLNQTNTLYKVVTEEQKREYVFPKANLLMIALLEIENVKSPSDLIIKVMVGSEEPQTTQLWMYRTKFLHQNEVFILDTSSISSLQMDLRKMDENYFSISAIMSSYEKFTLTLYAQTDQPEPAF